MVRLTRIGASPTEGSSTSRDLRRQHHRAAEREHLLLAARHAAGELRAALGEAGKGFEADFEVALELAPRGGTEGAKQEVFLHCQPRKQPPALGHERNAEIDDLFGAAADEIVMNAFDFGDDRARARAHDAHDALHQRRLAVAVGAEQRHGLAAADFERDVVDHAHRAVGGMNAGEREAIGQDTPSRLRDRASPRPACRRRSCGRRPARRGGARNS